MSRTMCVTALLLVLSQVGTAQQLNRSFDVGDVPGGTQEMRTQKSPTLAALLSWLVWPGVGSYYAGNSAHGTRHLVIGAASAAGALVLLATCDSDGFCDFDHDGVRLSAAAALGAAWLGNSIWSIITAVNDAERHNAGVAVGPVSFTPTITALTTTFPTGRVTDVGVQLASFSF